MNCAFIMLALLMAPSAATFNLSNTLGDGMVLQRGESTVVWGFGDPGVQVTTTFDGRALPASTVGPDGVWRATLPAVEARKSPTTLTFTGTDGGTAALRDVLFGDVILCSGQARSVRRTPTLAPLQFSQSATDLRSRTCSTRLAAWPA